MPILFIGDSKSVFWNSTSDNATGVEFISLEQQLGDSTFDAFARSLPINSFARKNFGFMLALHRGACQVVRPSFLSYSGTSMMTIIPKTVYLSY
jgi:hypothetical protein